MNMSVSYTIDRASSKKNIILQTAHRLFSEQCFGRAGIDRIIEESSVAKMTFYRHFKSKEQLIEACLEFEIENQISSINATCSQPHITSPIEKLQALYSWFIDRALDLDNRSCIINKALSELSHLHNIHKIVLCYNDWKYNFVQSILLENSITHEDTHHIFYGFLSSILMPCSFKPDWNSVVKQFDLTLVNT
ncbi:TetR/AcrR family transcriptional regulator [Acinetobacter guillouiae]